METTGMQIIFLLHLHKSVSIGRRGWGVGEETDHLQQMGDKSL